MAIFTTSPIVGSISGTVGGQTFVSAPRANVVRPRRRKTVAHTALAYESKTRFAVARSLWFAMTNAARDAWRQVAQQNPVPNRLGVRRPRSGWQTFVKYYPYGIASGAADILPPAFSTSNIIQRLSLTSTIAGATDAVTYAATKFTGGTGYTHYDIDFAFTMSENQPHFWKGWRQIVTQHVITPPDLHLNAEIIATFGFMPPENSWIALRYRATGSWLPTPWTQITLQRRAGTVRASTDDA